VLPQIGTLAMHVLSDGRCNKAALLAALGRCVDSHSAEEGSMCMQLRAALDAAAEDEETYGTFDQLLLMVEAQCSLGICADLF
jgi:hypothetical protein